MTVSDALASLYQQRDELNQKIVAAEYAAACSGKSVLDLPMQDNDAGAKTVREYLKELLAKVWEHGEGFSGKRPFGNSGWERDLHKPLVVAGLVAGKQDEDGYIDEIDDAAANDLIFEAIEAL